MKKEWKKKKWEINKNGKNTVEMMESDDAWS